MYVLFNILALFLAYVCLCLMLQSHKASAERRRVNDPGNSSYVDESVDISSA